MKYLKKPPQSSQWMTAALLSICVFSPHAQASDLSPVDPPAYMGPAVGDRAPTHRALTMVSSLAIAPKGRLWVTWYAGPTPGEDINNYVVLATSGDDGKTWTETLVIDPDGPGPIRAFDSEIWLDPEGRLWLFWAQAAQHGIDAVTWAMVTEYPEAENPEWSEPRMLAPGVMMCKPIVLQDGTWAFPISDWEGRRLKTPGAATAGFWVSKDRGETFSLRGAAYVPVEFRQYDEHMMIERQDGTLWMLVRTHYGIGESFSSDGGVSWTEVAPSQIPHPAARFFISRLQSGNLLLVKHGPMDERIGRSHLMAFISKDDGHTWEGGLLLDERSRISYPDGQQAKDGTLYITYDFDRTGARQILFATFREEDVLAGEAVSGAVRLRQLVSQGSGGQERPPRPPDQPRQASAHGVPLYAAEYGVMIAEGMATKEFIPGAKLFTDRAYTLAEVPAALNGAVFLQVPMNGSKTVEVSRSGAVYLLTPKPDRNKDSQTANLMEQGFREVALGEVPLFQPERGANFSTLYRKDAVAGETLTFGKWALPVVMTAPDSAVIAVPANAADEVLWLRPDAVLFSDRNYRLAECPDWLEGERFLRGSINATRMEVKEDGHLMVLTPQGIPGADSLAHDLEQAGFYRVYDQPFQLFGDKDIDKVLVYAKHVEAGATYAFDKWVVVLGFGKARGALDRTRAALDKSFEIYPADIPNTGLLLVDQAKDSRSGHGGITLTECKNGDILAFYSVTWAESWRGHGTGGWSQYKRSTDGGLTWSEPIVFQPSKEMWDGREVYSGLVFSVITAPDGTLVATVVRYANRWWEKQKAPLYYLSHDHGESWEGPHAFDEAATVEDISMTLSTHFVHDGKIFIVFRGGTGNMRPGGPHTLWVSEDNGKTFQQRSQLPFYDADYYWAAGVLDEGEIIVYTYGAHHDKMGGGARDADREKNIPYVISRDGGHTWSEVKTTYFAKGIRNMQLSGKLGEHYFIHGRSGSFQREFSGDDPGPGNFVLYRSKDGINWDEGVLLMSRLQTPGGGDCYSSNEIIGKYDPDLPERLMILSDISYDRARTNMHYWFVGMGPGELHFLKDAGAQRDPLSASRSADALLIQGKDDLGAILADE